MIRPNKEAVTNCPFCGSSQIVHVAKGTFFCGLGLDATEEEILNFLSSGGRSCGRDFSVYFRDSGSEKIKPLKEHWQKITQSLYQQGQLMPPRRNPVRIGKGG